MNGRRVEFLVDSGASTAVVNEELAQEAGLSGGTPATFQTANGIRQGRTPAHNEESADDVGFLRELASKPQQSGLLLSQLGVVDEEVTAERNGVVL